MNPRQNPLFELLAARRSEAFEIIPRVDARRHLARRFDPEFPLLLKLYSFPRYRRMVGEGWMHWHEYLEMIVPVRGAGVFRVGDQVVRFQPGDLLVVDNLKLHGVSQLSGPHRSLVVLFPAEMVAPAGCASADHGYLAPLCGRPEDVPPILRGSAKIARAVHTALFGLATAYFENGPTVDRYLAAKVHLLTILHHLREHFGLRQDYQEELQLRRQRQARLQQVFDWLAANSAGTITQPQAAAVAGMCPSRFREFFKQTTGRTFVDYVREMRLTHAAQMLRENGASIADIAAATGFADQSYLHRCFKAHYGYAPFEYRRHVRST